MPWRALLSEPAAAHKGPLFKKYLIFMISVVLAEIQSSKKTKYMCQFFGGGQGRREMIFCR